MIFKVFKIKISERGFTPTFRIVYHVNFSDRKLFQTCGFMSVNNDERLEMLDVHVHNHVTTIKFQIVKKYEVLIASTSYLLCIIMSLKVSK